jgi:uncharacterized membrane protein
MKIGKFPIASIILLVLALISFVMKRFYPGEYAMESQFIDGAFFGAGLVLILYYVNIYYTAWVNNKSENKAEANNSSLQ